MLPFPCSSPKDAERRTMDLATSLHINSERQRQERPLDFLTLMSEISAEAKQTAEARFLRGSIFKVLWEQPAERRLPSVKSRSFSRGTKNYTVSSRVGQYHVDALPDTGAQTNFISSELASRLRAVPRPGTKRTIQLPRQKRVVSPGAVKVPFSFAGEPERYMLDCFVLPGCTSDLVLSGGFLSVTRTLTQFRKRIKETLRDMRTAFRVCFLGNENNRLRGLVNGQPVLALPDTGSDVMLVSAKWAKKNKLIIDRSPEHELQLELADGSTAFTTGVVRNVRWTFGDSEQKVSCDFYVLDDLSVDVVLSNDFIFELDVFSRFSHLMLSLDSLPDLTEFYNMRLISKYSPELSELEGGSITDLNSPNAFSPEAIKAERVRRDQIRDAIDALPFSQQDQAWRDEINRQERWDRYRSQHRQKQTPDTSTTEENSSTQRTRWWELKSLQARIVGNKKSSR